VPERSIDGINNEFIHTYLLRVESILYSCVAQFGCARMISIVLWSRQFRFTWYNVHNMSSVFCFTGDVAKLHGCKECKPNGADACLRRFHVVNVFEPGNACAR